MQVWLEHKLQDYEAARNCEEPKKEKWKNYRMVFSLSMVYHHLLIGFDDFICHWIQLWNTEIKKGKSITCSSDQTTNPETTKTDLSHEIAVYFDLLGFILRIKIAKKSTVKYQNNQFSAQ